MEKEVRRASRAELHNSIKSSGSTETPAVVMLTAGPHFMSSNAICHLSGMVAGTDKSVFWLVYSN